MTIPWFSPAAGRGLGANRAVNSPGAVAVAQVLAPVLVLGTFGVLGLFACANLGDSTTNVTVEAGYGATLAVENEYLASGKTDPRWSRPSTTPAPAWQGHSIPSPALCTTWQPVGNPLGGPPIAFVAGATREGVYARSLGLMYGL
jgi:hypothetical protein